MKINVLYFLGIFIVLLSCKQEKSTVDKRIHTKQINKVELLVQSILDMEEFQAPLSLINSDNKHELFIVEQDSFGITQDLRLKKFNNSIRILDYNEVKRNSINNIIYFENFDVNQDTARIKLFYVIEGLGCDAIFIFKNGNWKEISSEFWYE